MPSINNRRFIRHAAIVSKYIVEGALDGMQRGNAQTITGFRREPIPIARDIENRGGTGWGVAGDAQTITGFLSRPSNIFTSPDKNFPSY